MSSTVSFSAQQSVQRTMEQSSTPLRDKLGQLTEPDKEELARALGFENRWKDFATHLLPVVGTKLNAEVIANIEARGFVGIQRARNLLNMISEWPEVTPELFVQTLDKAGLHVTANLVRENLGMAPVTATGLQPSASAALPPPQNKVV